MVDEVEENSQETKRRFFLIDLLEFAIVIVAALVLAWLMLTFVVHPYEIPTGSMERTILVQDRVLSEQVSYRFGDPQPGQIITFDDPEDTSKTLIKRLIAVGGQTVDFKDGDLYIDGAKQDEPYTLGKPSEVDELSGIEYPYTVPEGYVWVMGDNRTNSSDSRVFGPVPLENISGHAFVRYWPLDRFGLLD